MSKHVDIVEEKLVGRYAKCTMCGKIRNSLMTLPFFEFRGEGSREAKEVCHKCGMFSKTIPTKNGKVCYCGTDTPIPNVCTNLGEKCVFGPFDVDWYYCGCRGWE